MINEFTKQINKLLEVQVEMENIRILTQDYYLQMVAGVFVERLKGLLGLYGDLR